MGVGITISNDPHGYRLASFGMSDVALSDVVPTSVTLLHRSKSCETLIIVTSRAVPV
jgi:hypothetical protein